MVTGESLALLDTTGTLTQKYQAPLIPGAEEVELIAEEDTDLLRPFTRAGVDLASITSPINYPAAGQLLPIMEIFERLQALIGERFEDMRHQLIEVKPNLANH